jgi:hypothetical protein
MGILLAWAVEMGLITWRDLTGKDPTHVINGFPLPADYLATFLVFGTLGLVPKSNAGASKAATLAAWAFVIATYVNALPTALNPTAPPKGGASAAGTTAATPTSTPAAPPSSSTINPTGGVTI